MRSSRIPLALIAALAALMLLVSCSPAPPKEPASISGTITVVTPGEGNLGTVMVEGPGDGGVSYDKASVNVVANTRLLLKGADGYGRLTFADLRVGDTVDVWFTGAVAESYPVQATGGTIVVIR